MRDEPKVEKWEGGECRVVRVSEGLGAWNLEVTLTLEDGAPVVAPFTMPQDAARALAKALLEACGAREALRRRAAALRGISRNPTKPEAEACRYQAEGVELAMCWLEMESLLRADDT